MQSCCSPIASASAAAPREIATRSASTAAPRLHLLQLLLAACVCFSCSSRLRPFQLLLDCVRFGCSSPIASASTAAPRLCPIQLQLDPRLCPLRLLLPASCSGRFQPMLNVLEHSSQSSRFSKLKYEGRASLV